MSAGLSSADSWALFLIALLVLFMARRTYALSQGTPYSTFRTFGYGVYSTILFGILAATTIYVAVGTWGPAAYGLTAAYAAVGVAVGWSVVPRVRSLVQFEPRADGRLYYRLPIVIPALSLGLFVVRIAIEIGLLGLGSLASFTLPTTTSPGVLYLLIGADLVYVGSVGLLYGRGAAVRAAYADYRATHSVPSAPPPPPAGAPLP